MIKKKNIQYLILMLIVAGVTNVNAQTKPTDTIKLLKSSQERNSAQFNFANTSFLNPAIYFHTFNFSSSEFAIGYNKKEEDQAIVEQIGSGKNGYGFTATTYLSPGKRYRTWGKAQYLSNKIQGQYKNLTSDYERLYPYVTGDTLPTRDISGETYYLSGGYAQDQGKYTWGINASSRNLQEYRQVDPRPRNRVSDINLVAGLAWKLPQQYTLGLSGEYNIYKQAQTISFLADERRKINSALYHYSGLGNSSFVDPSGSFSYEGKQYGPTLSLYPISANGLFINLKFLYDSMDKNIAGSSALHTISNLGEDYYNAQIGWLGKGKDYSWAAKGNYNKRHRIGSEIIIASLSEDFNASGQYNYGLFPYYRENIDQLQLQLYFEKNTALRWYVMPHITYTQNTSQHIHPQRNQDWKRINYKLSTGLSIIKGKHLFMFNLQGSYDQHLSSHQDISNRLLNINSNGVKAYEDYLRHATATEQANYRFISTNNKHLGASARWEANLLRNKSLFVSPSYQKGWYTAHVKTEYFEISVGLVL